MRHGRDRHEARRHHRELRAEMREHMQQHMQEQMRAHGAAHRAWWAAGRVRGRWRHFIAAHLHRRLFMWFGISIFVSVTVANMVHGLVGRGRGHWLFAMLAAGMALWLISGKIAYRLARPLQELLRVTEEIGAGHLSARVEIPPWHMGEIAYIGQAVNDMAGRIQKQVGDQRELLAGVSHEIRTPLARIRVLLELGRSRGGDAKTFDELEREVLEIDALVGQLLASARLDFADLSVRTLDAVEVARRALERAGVAEEGVLDVAPAPGAALDVRRGRDAARARARKFARARPSSRRGRHAARSPSAARWGRRLRGRRRGPGLPGRGRIAGESRGVARPRARARPAHRGCPPWSREHREPSRGRGPRQPRGAKPRDAAGASCAASLTPSGITRGRRSRPMLPG